MNCFQNFYLCGLFATFSEKINNKKVLWIAFKIFIFVDYSQQNCTNRSQKVGCELLSKFLSLWIIRNAPTIILYPMLVVNCFQNFYLCGLFATWWVNTHVLKALWIAFKIFIFVDYSQLNQHKYLYLLSCELLSKFLSLWIIRNVWFYFNF